MPRFALLFLVFALLALPAAAAATAPLPTAAGTAPQAKTAPVNAPAPVGPVIESSNPYTVKGVKVDVQAESSVKARDKAFIQGGRDAFVALARQLTSDESYKAEGISDPQLTTLIKSFEVETERASGTRYVATLTFHFKPQEVSGLLAQLGKEINEDPYAKQQTTPEMALPPQQGPRTVIIPITRLPSRSVLWEEKTPWHKAWENILSDHPRGDVLLPEGNMDDIGTISAAEALAGSQPAMQRIMGRYQAQGTVVMALMASDMEMSPALGTNIQIARFDSMGKILGTATITLSGNTQKRLMEWLQGGASAALGAMDEISRKYAEQGQMQPVQPLSPPGIPPGYDGVVTRVLINVPFTNMNEWAARRAAIEAVPGITRLEVLRMNRNRAMVQFDYIGEQPALDAALSQRSMKVVPAPENDGSYLLLMGGPAAPPMARQPVMYQAPSQAEGENDEEEP